jgi:hypothetical protein
MTITVPTTAQVSASLERAARAAAPVVALVITCALLLIQLAYDLGYMLGSAVHARNDQLAALWRCLMAPEAMPAKAGFTAPAVHPLAELVDELEAMTCKQLRALSGIRSKQSKAQLIAAYLAA